MGGVAGDLSLSRGDFGWDRRDRFYEAPTGESLVGRRRCALRGGTSRVRPYGLLGASLAWWDRPIVIAVPPDSSLPLMGQRCQSRVPEPWRRDEFRRARSPIWSDHRGPISSQSRPSGIHRTAVHDHAGSGRPDRLVASRASGSPSRIRWMVREGFRFLPCWNATALSRPAAVSSGGPPGRISRLLASSTDLVPTPLGLEIRLGDRAPEEILALLLRHGVTARATRIVEGPPSG